MANHAANTDGNGAIAAMVREEIARQRLSREQVAQAARISISTLEKGLSGQRPFTLATLVRLETALGLSLRAAAIGPTAPAPIPSHGVAPDELGNYTRASVRWLEGRYLTVLPSFSERGAIYAYRTDIRWDDAEARLKFHEAERLDPDFTQFGDVSVPLQSGHVYLVTNRHGQHRLVVLARPAITGEMHGLLTTLQAGKGSHLSPVAVPIVLSPLKGSAATPAYGRIRPGDGAFSDYRRLLRRAVDDGYCRFVVE
jgi:transcriptional regulator with XRE-family HTH domain